MGILENLLRRLTLEYSGGDDGYIGQIREKPEVAGRASSLTEIEEKLKQVYRLISDDGTELGIAKRVLRQGIDPKDKALDALDAIASLADLDGIGS